MRRGGQLQIVQIGDLEKPFDLLSRFFFMEIPIREFFDEEGGHPLFEGCRPKVPFLLFGNEQLRDATFLEKVDDLFPAIADEDVGLTGGDVQQAGKKVFVFPNRRQEVRAIHIDEVLFDHRARCHHARDLSPHDPFGEGRILHLIADGDLKPRFYEAFEVVVERVIRDTRHRDTVARGQNEL